MDKMANPLWASSLDHPQGGREQSVAGQGPEGKGLSTVTGEEDMQKVLRWQDIPEEWKDYLTAELGRAPGGALLIDASWGRCGYWEDPQELERIVERGEDFGDLLPLEVDEALERALGLWNEGEFLKKELPIYFGLPDWEALEEALEGAYSLDINPLPKLREALKKMGLPHWGVVFLPAGTMPTPAHLPCIGVRLELDPWEDNEGNQFYNRLVSLHVFDEEWADLLLGDDGVPEV